MKTHRKIKFELETVDTIFSKAYTSTSSLGGEVSLASALNAFIRDRPKVLAAQRSVSAAGALGASTVRELFNYLKAADFDTEILVGKKYLKSLVNPCQTIAKAVEEGGADFVRRVLTHGIVRVNGLALDVMYLRIGDSYERTNNYPMREFHKYWEYVLDVKHLVEITPETVKKMLNVTPLMKGGNTKPTPVQKAAVLEPAIITISPKLANRSLIRN